MAPPLDLRELLLHIGPRFRIHELIHIADAPTALHEPLAPLMPDFLERLKRHLDRLVERHLPPLAGRHRILQHRGQAQRILDADACTSPMMRRGSMRGIAGQTDLILGIERRRMIVRVEDGPLIQVVGQQTRDRLACGPPRLKRLNHFLPLRGRDHLGVIGPVIGIG